MAPFALVRQFVIGMRPDKSETEFYAQRRFVKSTFHDALKAAMRDRARATARTARAWARGYLSNPAAFDEAAEAGLDGFAERLVSQNPGVHPLAICFGMNPEAAVTWFNATLRIVTGDKHSVWGDSFVQAVCDFDIPYDYFQRLYEVHEEAQSGYNAPAFLHRLAPDTLRQVLAQLAMLRAPRRDCLAWASLCEDGEYGYNREKLIKALPFLIAAGCSPAEASRLRGLGVTDPMQAVRIVADDVSDEYVYTVSRDENRRLSLVGV